MTLPLTAATGLSTVIAGAIITRIGHYVPFMFLGSIFIITGAVFTTQFQPDTTVALWVPALILIGLGIGSGQEQPQLAAQTILSEKDVLLGLGVVIFAQTLGQAIFISLVGNVINNELFASLREKFPGIDRAGILAEVAAELQNTLPVMYKTIVKGIYDKAITQTFYVCVGMARLALLFLHLLLWSGSQPTRARSLRLRVLRTRQRWMF